MDPRAVYAVQLTDNIRKELNEGGNPHRVIAGSRLYENLAELVQILREVGRAYSIAKVEMSGYVKDAPNMPGVYTAIKEFAAKFIPLDEMLNA